MIAYAREHIRTRHLAIGCVAIACSLLVQGLGDNQTSHYALIRALSHGTARIDPYRNDTSDKVRLKGHFYSNKPPGLAMYSVLPYLALDAAGVPEASRRAGRANGHFAHDHLGQQRGVIWALGLFGVVLPGALLLFLVGGVADRLAPGFGVAAAVTVGLCTLLLPLSTLFFAHVLATTLAFAAFALLLRERRGPPRLGLVAAAGLLSGLAVTTDYPLAAVGAVLFVYALARTDRPRRALSFAAGALVGIIPLLAYNWWAFGSPLHLSYSGFEIQSAGFFGVRVPSLRVALELLLGKKGLLVMSPVLAMAAAGVVLMYRAGRRAEALAIGGIAAIVLLYNAGFHLDRSDIRAAVHPFGGASPGPRILSPILPFLGVGLAAAYRRFPIATLASAVVSAGWMITATTTAPLVYEDISVWGERLVHGDFTATVLTELGAGHGWLALAPFLVAVAAAVALAARLTPRPQGGEGDVQLAVSVVGASFVAALLGHRLLSHEWGFGQEYGRLALAMLAVLACTLILLRLRSSERRVRQR